jgi:pimeloyl-ACP methyl ester carboxylesterase
MASAQVLKWIVWSLSGLAALTAMVIFVALLETRERIAALNAESVVMTVRSGAIEFLDWGEGPSVLVLHGAGGGFDQGKLLAEAVGSDGMRFISVSRFGYLRSSLPPQPTVSAQAETLLQLLDGLSISRVNIIAMSGGAPPALKFAEMYPDRTGRIILLSSAPFTPFSPVVEKRPVPTWVYSVLLGNDVVYWTLTKIARNQLREAFDARRELRRGLSQSERAFIESLIDGFLPASKRLKGLANEIAAVDPDTTYNLEAINARALVFHAKDDRMNPVSIGETIARRAPNAELVEFETGGHLLLGHHDQIRARIRNLILE